MKNNYPASLIFLCKSIVEKGACKNNTDLLAIIGGRCVFVELFSLR